MGRFHIFPNGREIVVNIMEVWERFLYLSPMVRNQIIMKGGKRKKNVGIFFLTCIGLAALRFGVQV